LQEDLAALGLGEAAQGEEDTGQVDKAVDEAAGELAGLALQQEVARPRALPRWPVRPFRRLMWARSVAAEQADREAEPGLSEAEVLGRRKEQERRGCKLAKRSRALLYTDLAKSTLCHYCRRPAWARHWPDCPRQL
jgi:hypothetical protein